MHGDNGQKLETHNGVNQPAAGLCSLDPLVGRYINPKPGDSFVKNGKTVSVISVTPTCVTWDYKHGDCLHYETSSLEEWAVLVQKTMAHGATFVPANSSGKECPLVRAGAQVDSTALLAAADYHDEIAKAADDNAELCRYTRSDFDFWCQKRTKHQKWAEAIRLAANK